MMVGKGGFPWKAAVFSLIVSAAAALFIGCATISADEKTRQSGTADRIVASLKQAAENRIEAVFIHGAGTGTGGWVLSQAARYRAAVIDWSEEAADRISAPVRGYSVGLAAGRELAADWLDPASPQYHPPEALVLYAHSAGAWVAQGLIDGLNPAAAAAAGVPVPEFSVVFLDPFTARSPLQPFAGRRLLGLGLAETRVRTYYSRRDPIPFTAGATAAGARFDLTALLDPVEDPLQAHWQVIDYVLEKELSSKP